MALPQRARGLIQGAQNAFTARAQQLEAPKLNDPQVARQPSFRTTGITLSVIPTSEQSTLLKPVQILATAIQINIDHISDLILGGENETIMSSHQNQHVP